MGSQHTCLSPTDPSPPVLLICQYINLPYGSCSAMMGDMCRLHPAAWAKHVAIKEGSPLPTTWCSPPQHPESCQDPCCYARVSGLRLGRADAWEGAESGPGCSQGMGLTGEELNLAHGPICSPCLQSRVVRTESVGQGCPQVASSTHSFGKTKLNAINILALHFSTNAARISLLRCFVNN